MSNQAVSNQAVSNQAVSGAEAGAELAGSGAAKHGPRLSVSLGLWQDRPAAEVVRTAEVALVPGSSEADPAGVATLTALAP